jgi:BRCT domain type II-containing protein
VHRVYAIIDEHAPIRTRSDPGTPTTCSSSSKQPEPVRRHSSGAVNISKDTVADETIAKIKKEFISEHKDLDERSLNVFLDRLEEETIPTITKGSLKRKVDRVRQDEGRCRDKFIFRPRKLAA